MKRLISVMLIIVMVLGLTACSSSNEPETAKRDDVNLTIVETFASTDAHGNRTVNQLLWKEQIYEPLFHMNELTLEYEPRLATEYSVSDDGLVYTFKLRDDVKFHNGEDFKASDVVFSYEHITNEPSWKTFYGNIDYVEALDDYTVAIHFLTKSAAAMNNIAQIWIESEKEVTDQGEAFGTKACLAGTGPYYIEEYNPESNVVLKAFPDYYRGEAAIKTVRYKYIAEADPAVMALEAKELDWYCVTAASSFATFENNPEYNTEIMAANHITFAFINYDANDVLRNDKVREAIAYALDKEAMNQAAFDGYAIEADYMENPAYNVGAPKGDIVYNYNPEKAKELLAEAGYPDGVDVGTILTSASNYFSKVAIVMQSNLEAVGMHAEIEVMEGAAAIAAFRAQEYELGVLGYTNTGDYDSFRQRVHSANVGGYYVKFEGDKFDYKRFDQLFADQLVELDLTKRLKITKELNDAVMETCCLLPIFHKPMLYAWDANLNVVNTPNFPDVYDWSWK